MKTTNLNRRSFIKKTAATTAGIGAISLLPGASLYGSSPGGTVNIALIGCRNMGFGILKHSLSFDDVKCVAMCDVDSKLLDERAAEVKKKFGDKPKLYADYRKMLEQKDIDAVIIGTPDHWHCLQTVDACAAGKDVYVEKPMANSIEECNIMVKAAKYYDRVVQVGQQQRNNPIFQEVMKLVRSEHIGKLRKVNLWANFGYGLGSTPVEDGPVPEGVDYDMWLGPAPKRPFNQNRFHGSWRHYWDYGGGMFSDWGVHLIDMGLWVNETLQGPDQVMTFAANNSAFEKARETFDTMNAIYPTEDFVINYDMTAGVQEGPYDNMYGTAFIGDKGTVKADRHSYRIIPEWDKDKEEFMIESYEFKEGQEAHKAHVRNFIDCVKSRETPDCPPEAGRAAAMRVHISNIAARISEPVLLWDDQENRFTNSEKANSYIVPEYRAPWKLPKIG